jgi:Cu-Zn family superoxide dismutase
MEKFNDLSSVLGRRPDAVAFIKGSSKYPDIEGSVLFFGGSDSVMACTEIISLPKGDGECRSPIFAYHIHSGTSCSGNDNDPFGDAKVHFNPKSCPHPYHAGDMLPLFGVNGRAFSVFLTDRFSVPQILGKTVIIHALPDDFTTQPSGNAGEKIACGIITPTAR